VSRWQLHPAPVWAMFARPMRRLAPFLLLLATIACAGGRGLSGDIKFGKTAEDDYKSGADELKDKNYPEATKYFEHVKSKYPFSRYAALSELRLADVAFAQERFVESADAYSQFIKLHPTSDQADYAAFRVGFSHWKEAPGDFMLFPPSYERDLAAVRNAQKSLESFTKSYPDSKYRPEAEKLLADLRSRLAEHEWYAYQFYAKRARWPGAAARLERLVKDYPGSRREPEALLALADVYLKLDERFRAQQALQQLIVKHPQDPRRAEAEKLLAALR